MGAPRSIADTELIDQIKGTILDGIRANLKSRYPQQLDACAELDVDPPVVSRLMNGRIDMFSLSYLCILASRMELEVSIKVGATQLG